MNYLGGCVVTTPTRYEHNRNNNHINNLTVDDSSPIQYHQAQHAQQQEHKVDVNANYEHNINRAPSNHNQASNSVSKYRKRRVLRRHNRSQTTELCLADLPCSSVGDHLNNNPNGTNLRKNTNYLNSSSSDAAGSSSSDERRKEMPQRRRPKRPVSKKHSFGESSAQPRVSGQSQVHQLLDNQTCEVRSPMERRIARRKGADSKVLCERSQSVKDLNREEDNGLNMRDPDAVTRWTSQILAQIECLPQSCNDLTATSMPSIYNKQSQMDHRPGTMLSATGQFGSVRHEQTRQQLAEAYSQLINVGSESDLNVLTRPNVPAPAPSYTRHAPAPVPPFTMLQPPSVTGATSTTFSGDRARRSTEQSWGLPKGVRPQGDAPSVPITPQSVPPTPLSPVEDPLDAFTQTSPASLSRSSSFTWLPDPEPEQPTLMRAQSTRHSNQSDVYVTQVHVPDEQFRSVVSTDSANRRGIGAKQLSLDVRQQQYEHLDESLRVLLECSNTAALTANTVYKDNQLNNNSRKTKSPSPSSASYNPAAVGAGVKKMTPPTVKYGTQLRTVAPIEPYPFTMTAAGGNTYQRRQHAQHPVYTTQSRMHESVYDNLPASPPAPAELPTQRKWLASKGLLKPTVDSWSSNQFKADSPADGSMLGGSGKSSERHSLPRDLSLTSSIVADSESSPMSTDNATNSTVPNWTEYDEWALEHNLSGRPSQCQSHSKPNTPAHGSCAHIYDEPYPFISNKSSEQPMSTSWTSSAGQNTVAQSMPSLEHCGLLPVSVCTPNAPVRLHSNHSNQTGRSAINLTNLQDHGDYLLNREQPFVSELDATEACAWLRAAGFPQYVHMYEEGRLPDARSVASDHPFLDADSLQTLFRRLEVLNRCAALHDQVILRRQQNAAEECEEDDVNESTVALSRQWHYQRKSRTWSRVAEQMLDLQSDTQSLGDTSKVDTVTGAGTGRVIYDAVPDDTHMPLVHSLVAQHSQHTSTNQEREQRAAKLQRSQSERIKDRAKALMRRMDLRASSRHRRQTRNGHLHISSPVLLQRHSASPPVFRQDDHLPDTNIGSNGKRFGRVFGGQEAGSSDESSSADSPEEPPATYTKQIMARVDRNSNEITFVCRFPNSTTGSIGPVVERRGSAATLSAPSTSQPSHRHSLTDVHRTQQTEYMPGLSVPNMQQPDERNASSANRRSVAQVHFTESSGTTGSASGQASRAQASRSSVDSSDTDTNSPYNSQHPQESERRDSGVGSSLSRSPSGPGRRCVSKAASGSTTVNEKEPFSPLDSLSVPELITTRKYALLTLTSMMERHSPASARSNGGWHWGVHRLLKRIKNTDSKSIKDRQVFGVPLHVMAQKTGQPLPLCIQYALHFLREQAPDAHGIFRKSGVRSRIQKLRTFCETSVCDVPFRTEQTYDVADMLKQYFRDLPDPLLTTKMSDTFIAAHMYLPVELRLEALQKAVLMLPDENRETLHTLLYFLRDISSHASTNQMTAQNLSVCFAPSLFHLSGRVGAMSPTRRHKTIGGAGGLGMPSEKELRENQAAQSCLTQMITECKQLFVVSSDGAQRYGNPLIDCYNPQPLTLDALGGPTSTYTAYLLDCVHSLLMEHRDGWKRWITEGAPLGVEISSKKPSNDSHPLKLWRCWADIDAPPSEILLRVLHERSVWDEACIKQQLIQQMTDTCDVTQYVLNDMPPHPTRDYCVVRLWRALTTEELRGGGFAIVETSVDAAPLLGGVRAFCLASRFLIEPSPLGGGRSRVTYMARVDTKGRGKAWYNSIYGHLCARQLARLRDSFRYQSEGPETKL